MSGTASAPLASVIVPFFNASQVIERCLRALQAQRGLQPGALEIIAVDDGSTDGSAELAAPLCDRLLRLEKNSGAAAARNAGAREASAPVLIFADADVIAEPDAARLLLDALASGGEPPDAAVGRYTATPAEPGPVNAYHNVFTRFHHDLSPREIDWFWGALSAVRADAFRDAGGFDERYRGASAEDMELGLALARAGRRIVYAPEAEGAHAHHFTLPAMLKNDYKKAALGMKLRLMRRLPERAPGFLNAGSVATAALLPMLAALIALSLLWIGAVWAAAAVAIMIAIVNRDFYSALRPHFPGARMLHAAALHWLQFAAVMAGAAAGTIGYFMGVSPHGKPGWI